MHLCSVERRIWGGGSLLANVCVLFSSSGPPAEIRCKKKKIKISP